MLMNQLLTQRWAGRPCSEKLKAPKRTQKFELWKQLRIALPCSHDKAPAYLCPDLHHQRDFETGRCVMLAPATLEFFQNHCWIHTHTCLHAGQCSQGPSGTSNSVVLLAPHWRTSWWMQPCLFSKCPHSIGFPSRRLQHFWPSPYLLVRWLFTWDYFIFIMT